MADKSARNYLVLGSLTPQQPQEKWYTQELKELSDIEYEPDEHTKHFDQQTDLCLEDLRTRMKIFLLI